MSRIDLSMNTLLLIIMISFIILNQYLCPRTAFFLSIPDSEDQIIGCSATSLNEFKKRVSHNIKPNKIMISALCPLSTYLTLYSRKANADLTSHIFHHIASLKAIIWSPYFIQDNYIRLPVGMEIMLGKRLPRPEKCNITENEQWISAIIMEILIAM